VSGYDNDPRVTRTGDYCYQVVAGADVYEVTAVRSETDWVAYPAFGARSMQGLMTREQAEAALESATRGPFASADEAIHSLIEDPR
jgi:hypothetical protein